MEFKSLEERTKEEIEIAKSNLKVFIPSTLAAAVGTGISYLTIDAPELTGALGVFTVFCATMSSLTYFLNYRHYSSELKKMRGGE